MILQVHHRYAILVFPIKLKIVVHFVYAGLSEDKIALKLFIMYYLLGSTLTYLTFQDQIWRFIFLFRIMRLW